MKFSVVVAVFLLVAKPAYVGTVSERSMEDVPVSSGECLEVIENGNFIKQNNEKEANKDIILLVEKRIKLTHKKLQKKN